MAEAEHQGCGRRVDLIDINHVDSYVSSGRKALPAETHEPTGRNSGFYRKAKMSISEERKRRAEEAARQQAQRDAIADEAHKRSQEHKQEFLDTMRQEGVSAAPVYYVKRVIEHWYSNGPTYSFDKLNLSGWLLSGEQARVYDEDGVRGCILLEDGRMIRGSQWDSHIKTRGVHHEWFLVCYFPLEPSGIGDSMDVWVHVTEMCIQTGSGAWHRR